MLAVKRFMIIYVIKKQITFLPHQCFYTRVQIRGSKGSAAMQAIWRWTGVAPEVNLMNSLHAGDKACKLGLTRSPNEGPKQWPHKNDWCPPIFFNKGESLRSISNETLDVYFTWVLLHHSHIFLYQWQVSPRREEMHLRRQTNRPPLSSRPHATVGSRCTRTLWLSSLYCDYYCHIETKLFELN